MGDGTGMIGALIGFHETFENLVAFAFISDTVPGKSKTGVFSRKESAGGVLFGFPVGGIIKSALSVGEDHTFNMIFGKGQYSVHFNIVKEFTVPGKIQR